MNAAGIAVRQARWLGVFERNGWLLLNEALQPNSFQPAAADQAKPAEQAEFPNKPAPA